MDLSRKTLAEITEIIEDTTAYICDSERISGEMAWNVIETLATAKLTEMNNLIGE